MLVCGAGRRDEYSAYEMIDGEHGNEAILLYTAYIVLWIYYGGLGLLYLGSLFVQ